MTISHKDKRGVARSGKVSSGLVFWSKHWAVLFFAAKEEEPHPKTKLKHAEGKILNNSWKQQKEKIFGDFKSAGLFVLSPDLIWRTF